PPGRLRRRVGASGDGDGGWRDRRRGATQPLHPPRSPGRPRQRPVGPDRHPPAGRAAACVAGGERRRYPRGGSVGAAHGAGVRGGGSSWGGSRGEGENGVAGSAPDHQPPVGRTPGHRSHRPDRPFGGSTPAQGSLLVPAPKPSVPTYPSSAGPSDLESIR